MGIRRGVLGDGADSGGLGVDVLEDKLKLSEVDNLLSNPSVVSSWLLGYSTTDSIIDSSRGGRIDSSTSSQTRRSVSVDGIHHIKPLPVLSVYTTPAEFSYSQCNSIEKRGSTMVLLGWWHFQ